MIQTIKYACCDNIFAACREPECYTESSWLKDIKKYAKQGCKIELVESCVFGVCKCKKSKTKKEEPNLFNT